MLFMLRLCAGGLHVTLRSADVLVGAAAEAAKIYSSALAAAASASASDESSQDDTSVGASLRLMSSIAGSTSAAQAYSLLLPQSAGAWSALQSIWSPGVYIPARTDLFAGLTATVAARFGSWLVAGAASAALR